MIVYEVLAIRYATFRRPKREIFLSNDVHEGSVDLDYYVWLIRNGERMILVDTGFNERSGAERNRKLIRSPADGLRLLGIDPSSVSDVIITHLHFDHAGNLADFPNARIHIQDAEIAFATGRCMCHKPLRHPFDVEDVVLFVRKVYAGRVVFHDGDEIIFPGISLHRVPGHSKGLQVVRVMTARGHVVLASDASHFYDNMRMNDPFPVLVDVEASLEGYSKLRAIADGEDHIVPGHDHEVSLRYPRYRDAPETFALHEPPLAA